MKRILLALALTSNLAFGSQIFCGGSGGGGGGTSWLLAGNAGTSPGSDFLGTTDSQDIVVKTNGTERFRITAAGVYDSNLGTGIIHSDSSGLFSSSTIVNADISASAAIARSKIAAGTASHVVVNDGAGALSSVAVLPIAQGGSNKALTLAAGGVLWTDADSFEVSAAGSAGQFLTSTGTTAPAWTTSTFPATATGTGTILRADGTNWVATTATYPATTTANQILYSSSTSVIGQITTAATSALVTNSSSVPSLTSGSTANRLLRTDGTTVSFAQAALATDVSGVLPIANGGSNKALTLAAGGLLWTDADSFEVGAAGTTSDWALSGGTGAPTFSSTTTTAKFVDGSADAIQMRVQGHSTQTSNIVSVEKSDATVLLNVTNVNGTAIRGSTTNDTAAAGFVGEIIESTQGSSTNFTTSGQYSDIVSISLTPGSWMLDWTTILITNGATVTQLVWGVGTVTGNSGTGLSSMANSVTINATTSYVNDFANSMGGIRKEVASTTTFYLKANATYSVATPQFRGRLTAIRFR